MNLWPALYDIRNKLPQSYWQALDMTGLTSSMLWGELGDTLGFSGPFYNIQHARSNFRLRRVDGLGVRFP